jgi:hypothetical protein
MILTAVAVKITLDSLAAVAGQTLKWSLAPTIAYAGAHPIKLSSIVEQKR